MSNKITENRNKVMANLNQNRNNVQAGGTMQVHLQPGTGKSLFGDKLVLKLNNLEYLFDFTDKKYEEFVILELPIAIAKAFKRKISKKYRQIYGKTGFNVATGMEKNPNYVDVNKNHIIDLQPLKD